MKWIIDRFEGKIAVIECGDENHFDLPRSALPDGAKEGDVITVRIDDAETEARRKRIAELRKRLFAD